MKAARIVEFNGPDGLRLEQVADPVPSPTEVLVRVKATALNRADLLQTMGLYPAPPGVVPDIPGLEYAGEVVALGKKVKGLKKGQRVMGLTAGGAFAELVAVDARTAMNIPRALSFEQAAAIPEAFITAWDAAWLQGGLRKGQALLIHAVGSGVGTAAVQLCRALGCRSLGTARSADKLDRAAALGLEVPLLCAEGPSFAEQVRHATEGTGAHVALDLVGGDYLPETIRAMAMDGTIMLVGLSAGASTELNLGALLGSRLRLQGTTLRNRSVEHKAALSRRFATAVLPLFGKKRLQPVVGATVPMAEVAQALNKLAANDSFGKTVLTW